MESNEQTKRLFGHQRIFQSVFNDLNMRHEIVTDKDGKQRYAYVYDGLDPYELEDSHFPITKKLITRYGLEQRKEEADWFIEVRYKALMDGGYPDHAVIHKHYTEITKQLEELK